MKKRVILWLVVFPLIISLTACNFPSMQSATPDHSALDTIVAQDVLLTQMAATLTANYIANPGENATEQPAALSTQGLPLATTTIPPTPLPSATATPQGVWLTINENSNCRIGPASYYPLVTALTTGSKVQVVGRNPQNDYSYVRVAQGTNTYCWVWDRYSSINGNTSNLPVFTPMPSPTPTLTPTPAPGFTISYNSLVSCVPQYALRLFIRNTGSVTWQSIRILVVDSTAGITSTHTSDNFKSYTGCGPDLVQADLTPGEESYVSNISPGQFNYDPTGHALTVTITLFSSDGLSGTTAQQIINITP
jgi:hypothetical protein